jgi:hypothetical protein
MNVHNFKPLIPLAALDWLLTVKGRLQLRTMRNSNNSSNPSTAAMQASCMHGFTYAAP